MRPLATRFTSRQVKAMSRVTLRAAEPADNELVTPWLAEAVAAVEGSRKPGLPVTLPQFLSKLNSTDELLVIALADNRRAAGLAVIGVGGEASPRIDFFAIAEGYRN